MKRLRLETLQSKVPAANLFCIRVSSPEDIARSVVEETNPKSAKAPGPADQLRPRERNRRNEKTRRRTKGRLMEMNTFQNPRGVSASSNGAQNLKFERQWSGPPSAPSRACSRRLASPRTCCVAWF